MDPSWPRVSCTFARGVRQPPRARLENAARTATAPAGLNENRWHQRGLCRLMNVVRAVRRRRRRRIEATNGSPASPEVRLLRASRSHSTPLYAHTLFLEGIFFLHLPSFLSEFDTAIFVSFFGGRGGGRAGFWGYDAFLGYQLIRVGRSGSYWVLEKKREGNESYGFCLRCAHGTSWGYKRTPPFPLACHFPQRFPFYHRLDDTDI